MGAIFKKYWAFHNPPWPMISVANAPGNDEITGEQALVFKAALPHIDRAVRIHRELRLRDLDHDTASDRECLPGA
jgi:hypothetical protein